MQVVDDFYDYKLLDTSDGLKLEVWHKSNFNNKCDASYERSNTGGGKWNIYNNKLPNYWQVKYQDMTFNVKLMGFKHTGIFPEQAYNWNYLRKKIKESNKKDIKVLNLFAYTGCATVACLMEGAHVTHVDSSKGMIEWAKENVALNVSDAKVRFLVDDVVKFVKREIRRGNKYDIIIMDPPSFGRGSNGEVWSIEKDLFNLVTLCNEILSDDPIMLLINSYTTGLSMSVIKNVLELALKSRGGKITCDELGVVEDKSKLVLPCGEFTRWEK